MSGRRGSARSPRPTAPAAGRRRGMNSRRFARCLPDWRRSKPRRCRCAGESIPGSLPPPGNRVSFSIPRAPASPAFRKSPCRGPTILRRCAALPRRTPDSPAGSASLRVWDRRRPRPPRPARGLCGRQGASWWLHPAEPTRGNSCRWAARAGRAPLSSP